jgi:hypothetical protein
MKKSKEYYGEIKDALSGADLVRQGVPAERLDWGGTSAVLDLFDRTSGPERGEFINALGRIIEEASEPPVVAQVIDIVASLDISELAPVVAKVRQRKVGEDPNVSAAVANFQAFRELKTHKK